MGESSDDSFAIDQQELEALRVALLPVLDGFLTRMETTIPEVCVIDPELELRVKAISDHWPNEPSLRAHIKTGIYLAGTAYRHLPLEPRKEVALYTALLASLDDPAIMRAQPAGDFTQMLLTGAIRPGMGLFAELAACVTRLRQHYPRFAASSILTSTMDAVSSTQFENETQELELELVADAAPFLEYRRYKTGISEAFAFFIWDVGAFPDDKVYMQAIPDIGLFLSYCNDILSFYKEEVAVEAGTYVWDRAIIEKISRLEALQGLIDDTVAIAQRIQRILGEGKARELWDIFTGPYIGFHLAVPRYNVHEVLGHRCRIEC